MLFHNLDKPVKGFFPALRVLLPDSLRRPIRAQPAASTPLQGVAACRVAHSDGKNKAAELSLVSLAKIGLSGGRYLAAQAPRSPDRPTAASHILNTLLLPSIAAILIPKGGSSP